MYLFFSYCMATLITWTDVKTVWRQKCFPNSPFPPIEKINLLRIVLFFFFHRRQSIRRHYFSIKSRHQKSLDIFRIIERKLITWECDGNGKRAIFMTHEPGMFRINQINEIICKNFVIYTESIPFQMSSNELWNGRFSPSSTWRLFL